VSFEVPDATGRTITYAVVVRGGWLQREQGDAFDTDLLFYVLIVIVVI